MRRLVALIHGPAALKMGSKKFAKLTQERLELLKVQDELEIKSQGHKEFIEASELYKEGKRQGSKSAIRKKGVIIAILAFVVGLLAMYLLDLASVVSHKATTQAIIENSRQTYELQRKITLNYSNAYDILANCVLTNTCNINETLKKFQDIQTERESLVIELEELNKETEAILKK